MNQETGEDMVEIHGLFFFVLFPANFEVKIRLPGGGNIKTNMHTQLTTFVK